MQGMRNIDVIFKKYSTDKSFNGLSYVFFIGLFFF